MYNTEVIVELEKTVKLNLVATPIYPHVWRYTLWITAYEKTLPFMAETDDYNTEQFSFGSITADYAPLYRAVSVNDCIANEATYFVDGPTLYVHNADHRPPYIINLYQYGQIIGFTNSTVRRFNRVTYLPEVVTVPNFSVSTDPLEYKKMAFISGSATLRNFLKYFDDRPELFGNDCNIKIGEIGQPFETYKNVLKFFVNNYTCTPSQARFALKDKREMLSTKVPSAMFSTDDFPYLDDDTVDEIIPDAYGYCIGIPGICLNATAGNVAKVFRFASVITELTAVQVYYNEKWNTVTPVSTDYPNGTVTLSVAQAHDGGTSANGLLDVKATGTFRPETTVSEIIKHLLNNYFDVPFNSQYYDMAEFENELSVLAPVGLYMDESKSIYEWIERLQYGSTVGFQFWSNFGLYTARLDNPNRDPNNRIITSADILNIRDVEIDYNRTLFATSSKVAFAKDYQDDTYNYEVNTDYFAQAKELYRRENVAETETLLALRTDAAKRAKLIMDDQHIMRPIYKGIQLFGLEWFDLRLYDIVYADMRIPEVPCTPIVQDGFLITDTADDEIYVTSTATDEYVAVGWNTPKRYITNSGRDFAGYQRGQIIKIRYDVQKCVVEIDIRQRDQSSVYAEEIE